jgi:hypothetical protein
MGSLHSRVPLRGDPMRTEAAERPLRTPPEERAPGLGVPVAGIPERVEASADALSGFLAFALNCQLWTVNRLPSPGHLANLNRWIAKSPC